MNDKKTLIIVIIAVVFFIMVITTGVLIGVALILSNSKPTTVLTPVTVEQPIIVPASKISQFASNSGTLKIRDDIKSSQLKIDTMDLFESQITPPIFDLNINIPPQT